MVRKRKCSLVLVCLIICLLISFSLIIYFSSTYTSDHSNDQLDKELEVEYSKYFTNTGNTSNFIHLEVFYEALCPDSQTFINNQLDKLLRNNRNKYAFQKYVRIDLIPFGKAYVKFSF